ncbi:MAG: DEAD/DEAH box helicase [Chloroflexota bacterium]|nr:DEAD/DEAH box helicase [Chloroflexota bacterium]
MTQIITTVSGHARYRVFHSPQEIREYYEDQLLASDLPHATDEMLKSISATPPMDTDVFRARLTAARLSRPQIDTLYALHAARIQYIPFQFKPLLRFLRADQPRLLIADEVGVGKTIEAGLILKEMQARQDIENVLIVCPKALVQKWRTEMRRFDEDFIPLTSETLQYCLREAHLDGAWPAQYSRAIVHLELLRIDEYLIGSNGPTVRYGLLNLNPPPRFSLLIVDEAHHLRNPGTRSHTLAKFLCDVSEAVVLLSATPVQIGSRNLNTLLTLLRPDLFPDEAVFAEIIEPNRYLMIAMRCVRNRMPHETWQAEAAAAIEEAAATSWGEHLLRQDPRFLQWRQALRSDAPLSDPERIRCLRDLEELHSLAHIVNRTRRRDIGHFTIREPHTVSVPFTVDQQRFYNALIDFRLRVLEMNYNPQLAKLIIHTLERQAASCLPALIPLLDRVLQTNRIMLSELTDDLEDEDQDETIMPFQLGDEAIQIREMASHLSPDDPKLDSLRAIITDTMTGIGPRKLLIFSSFLHTLGYLRQQLQATGYRVEVITGAVPDEERERLRNRFRLHYAEAEAIDVLLSSEVGCEGLDYEFCDRLVNYDIPWNPMRIEQRIGRIDRYGQASEKVLIFNFITPGTVEERIFFRCFERLDVFRETIGDLEEVLGEVVDQLTRVAFEPGLTAQQAEEKALQTADNTIRRLEEQRRLEEESSSLLGLDRAFDDEMETLLAEGRFVSPDDLRLMIAKFLEEPGRDGTIIADDRQPGMYRIRLKKESRAALLEMVRRLERHDPATVAFERWLVGDEPFLAVTFDQKTAIERRTAPFVTPVYPLARIAATYWTQKAAPLVARLTVVDDTVPAGQYLFVSELWETLAVKSDLRLINFVCALDHFASAPAVAAALTRLLSRATQPTGSAQPQSAAIERAFAQLDEEAHRLRMAELAGLDETNGTLIGRKLAGVEAYHRNRLARVQTQIAQATNERIIRMHEAERVRVERDYQRKRIEIESHRDADIISQRIAAGILEVRHAE